MFIMPIGLDNIGWQMYFVNASWDVIILGLIVSLLELCLSDIANCSGVLLGGDEGQDIGGDRRSVRG